MEIEEKGKDGTLNGSNVACMLHDFIGDVDSSCYTRWPVASLF